MPIPIDPQGPTEARHETINIYEASVRVGLALYADDGSKQGYNEVDIGQDVAPVWAAVDALKQAIDAHLETAWAPQHRKPKK